MRSIVSRGTVVKAHLIMVHARMPCPISLFIFLGFVVGR